MKKIVSMLIRDGAGSRSGRIRGENWIRIRIESKALSSDPLRYLYILKFSNQMLDFWTFYEIVSFFY